MTLRTADAKHRHETIRDSIMSLVEQYVHGEGWRLVELILAINIIQRGMMILFFDGMDAPYYADFALSGYAEVWGSAAVIIGAARLAGIIINGRWKRSPRLRWATAFMAMCFQGVTAALFIDLGLINVASTFIYWTFLEVLGFLRSYVDVIKRKRS